MKTAETAAAAIYITCPHCGSDMETQKGSQMFTAEDIPSSGVLTCETCGKKSKIPKRAPIYWDI